MDSYNTQSVTIYKIRRISKFSLSCYKCIHKCVCGLGKVSVLKPMVVVCLGLGQHGLPIGDVFLDYQIVMVTIHIVCIIVSVAIW